MSALSILNPTLLDLANRMDQTGTVVKDIVEMLHAQNEIIDDMTFIEANSAFGHKTKVRTGLPTPTWRKLYQGVEPGRSTVAEVTETMGWMEAFSELDCQEVDMHDNKQAYRMQEDAAHLEGMTQDLATTLFYGNESLTPAKFTGFAPRFNDPTAENGEQLINGGGSGSDNASIWLIGWSPTTVTGIVPKGIPAGFKQEDMGVQLVSQADNSNKKFKAYVSHYKWDVGLCVRDWRYVVRICNIDKSALTKDASAGADLLDLMTQAMEAIQATTNVRPAFYVPKTVRSFLRRQLVNKVASSTLSMGEVAGKPVVMFDNVPVRRCDALAGDEAAITGF